MPYYVLHHYTTNAEYYIYVHVYVYKKSTYIICVGSQNSKDYAVSATALRVYTPLTL